MLLVACMQEWQESPLCPSPAAADLSKDTPASCISLTSPLHLPVCSSLLINFQCVLVASQLRGGSLRAHKLHVVFKIPLRFRHGWLLPVLPDGWALSPLSAASDFLCLIGYFYFLLCVPLVFHRLLPVRVSVVLLIQVFLPTSGLSESGDRVRSPAASLFAHRELRYWAGSTSTAGSATQTLISSPAVPDGGWRPVTRGVSVQRDAKGYNNSSWNVWLLINASDFVMRR